jgi:hypothetical protein
MVTFYRFPKDHWTHLRTGGSALLGCAASHGHKVHRTRISRRRRIRQSVLAIFLNRFANNAEALI